MNNKFSLGVCISLIAVACAVTFVLTMTISLNIYNSKIAGVEERGAIYTKLQDIDSYVRTNFLGTIDEDRLSEGVMSGYMSGLGDSKSRYLTAAEYYETQQYAKGKIVTAGLETAKDESGYIIITEVYEGSSAWLQGIEAGDIITQIDGTQVLEAGAENAMKLLSGDEGTRVGITARRDGEEERYTLIRHEIELISAKGVKLPESDLGYIKITNLADNTGDQLETALDEILAGGAKGLIIDLRGLDGCLVAPLRQILDRLVPRGAAAVAEYKGGNINTIIEINNDAFVDLPITVITDGNTAQGGELLAAMLKDYAGAQIVGVNTKGDAVFTTTQMLRDGSAVVLSIMRTRSAGGTEFDNDGIRPDYMVEVTGIIPDNDPDSGLENLENTLDAQIRKAIEVTQTRVMPETQTETE